MHPAQSTSARLLVLPLPPWLAAHTRLRRRQCRPHAPRPLPLPHPHCLAPHIHGGPPAHLLPRLHVDLQYREVGNMRWGPLARGGGAAISSLCNVAAIYHRPEANRGPACPIYACHKPAQCKLEHRLSIHALLISALVSAACGHVHERARGLLVHVLRKQAQDSKLKTGRLYGSAEPGCCLSIPLLLRSSD